MFQIVDKGFIYLKWAPPNFTFPEPFASILHFFPSN